MIKFGKYVFEKKTVLMTCSVMMVVFLVCNSRPAAQDVKISPTKTPVATKSPAQAMNLKESLEKTLLAEQDNYQQLEVQLQQMLFFGKDIEAEIAVIHEAEQIIDLNPNTAYMLGTAGFWIAIAGEFERGLALMEQGIRLNPYYPEWVHYASFLHWYRQRNYEEALRGAHNINLPDIFWDPLLHVAALGQLGRQEDAHMAFQKLLRLRPDFPARAREYVSFYVLQDDLLEHMLEGLRKADL